MTITNSRIVVAAIASVLLRALWATPVSAERLVNRFDTRHGLPVAHVLSLAQDARGFVWIGTMGGLVRFDGREMRPWLRETLRGEILDIVALPRGTLIVRAQSTLFEVDDRAATPQYTEDGAVISGATGVVATNDGRLWAIAGGQLLARAASGRWRPETANEFDREPVQKVRRGSGDALLVATDDALWEKTPGDRPAIRLTQQPGIQDVIPWGRGYLALSFDLRTGAVVEINGTIVTRFALDGSRPIAVIRRGDVAWVAFDRFLVALRPGQPAEILGPKDGLSSGGPLLVDAEGSLWLATFTGVLQFPEPDTRSWTDLDGLPGAHTRSLALTDEGLWVATWQGLGRLVKTPEGWVGRNERIFQHTQLCFDGSGALIVMDQPNGALLTRVDHRFVPHAAPAHDWLADCAPARDGGVWYATDRALWIVADGARDAQVLAPPPDPRHVHHAIVEDHAGRLWISRGEEICHADARTLRAQRQAEWHCDSLPLARNVSSLIETAGGSIWASTLDAGVWRWRAGQWTPLPAAAQLPSQTMRGMSLARDGTVWIFGASVILRVREEQQPPGWSVVERLTPYHGLPSETAEDAFEDADGSVWLASSSGVTYVPPSARHAVVPAPRVELVAALVDGRTTPVDRGVSMQSGDNSLELRFAVLTFRDRRRLRFQLRLQPTGQWLDSPGDDTTVRFLNLGAGQYTVEARASLDDEHWSETVRLSLDVIAPWYRTWWAMSLGFVALLGIAAAWHRNRLIVQAQLGSQRARIARDLHDELGSGLGSIGILAGVAAGSDVGEAQRRTMAATIADTAQDLSGGLSDLVWSLSPKAVTLGGLAAHLAELGSRLVPGPCPRFETHFPASWPPEDLPLLVRRNVTLIALEALRNAVRHARAARILIGLEPHESSDWVLEVGDDGQGLAGSRAEAGSSTTDAGHGRANMSARAAEIGASLAWVDAPGGGTIVRLRFRCRPVPHRRTIGRFRWRSPPSA